MNPPESPIKSCKQCGQPMASDAPEGLCARCLLSVAMHEPESPTGVPPATDAAASSLPADIPDIGDAAEVARRLPQFEIMEMLGRGGMGVVYKARQLQLDRLVALKILPPTDALTPDFVERFRREARSLAKLSHANIVNVHDFGESGGLYYFAMEFVDGVNLREMIRTGKMTPAEALAVVPKICDALQFAHEEGVVHRDIKPENILIDKRGRVKIADFGLAKLLRREATDHTLTMSGMSLGTPRYMAPEQMDRPETVDHRADIYSLGVVFYEMLTGEVPMGRFAPPSEKVQIDVRLDEIVLHALERDVERRYQHASEVRDDVEKVTVKPQPALDETGPGSGPGEWLIRCTNCGHTKPLTATGGIRTGGVSAGKRFPIACSKCGGSTGTLVRAGSQQATVPDDPPAVSARLSRCALFGAIWAGLGLPAGILLAAAFLMTSVHTVTPAGADAPVVVRPMLGFVMIAIPLGLLAGSAPFGTTILGAVGIGQIRRSGGKLYGLRLAFADAVFFPLLVLGAIVGGLIANMISTGSDSRAGLAIGTGAIAALVVCFFVGRAVWRGIAGGGATSATPVSPQTSDQQISEAPAGSKPSRRHLLTAFLTLLSIFAFFFGANFRASVSQTAAGQVKLITVGSLDPVFVLESGPTGFQHSFDFFSWSFFALVVSGVAFAALLRISREDEGKVPRDPAWWHDWWKQVGIWGGLLLIACIVRTVMHPGKVLQPSGDRTVSAKFSGKRPPAPILPLGTITNGIGAEFTVPAGQVAILEIVTRRDNATVPVPPHCAYVLAGERAIAGTFRWSREPEQTGGDFRRWRIELNSGAGTGSTGGLALPEALDPAVGARGLALGVLEPNEETIHWGTADKDNLPADGLIGLRVTTVAHNLKAGGTGIAHIDWKKAQTKIKR